MGGMRALSDWLFFSACILIVQLLRLNPPSCVWPCVVDDKNLVHKSARALARQNETELLVENPRVGASEGGQQRVTHPKKRPSE